jgi:hypothetical protein
MKATGLLTALFALTCAGPLLADDAACGRRWWERSWTWTSNCPSLCGSPDDYCRKPFPSLTAVSRCGGPDDYCRKAAPCLSDISRCGGPNDYCRKSVPSLLCPPASPYLHYGSAGSCCVPGTEQAVRHGK